HSAGAAAIVDDDLVPQPLAQLNADHAADDIVAAARREWNDQPDRLVGIVLRHGRAGKQKPEQRQGNYATQRHEHPPDPAIHCAPHADRFLQHSMPRAGAIAQRFSGQRAWRRRRPDAKVYAIGAERLRAAMNYDTDFKSIRDEVGPEEWQTRVDLAACYRLVDRYGMTDL